MTDHVGSIGRGGVVMAMSGGLVATMGLPAHALSRQSRPDTAAPATAPIALGSDLLAGAMLAATAQSAAQAATGGRLSAPLAATVHFETGVFTAVPRKAAPAVHPTAAPAGKAGARALEPAVTGSFGSARGASVLSIAARYVGVSFRYGGSTPAGWDCSGATGYIFRQLGYDLPRTADQQMLATQRVSRSEARPGDLVFFLSGGRAYHVGIYAGNGMMYDAGRTGSTFSKRAIFSSSVIFGRVIR